MSLKTMPAPRLDFGVRLMCNPSQSELKELTLKYTPAVEKSGYGNLNKVSRNKSRLAKFTFVIGPDSEAHRYSHKTMPGEQAQPLIDGQAAYIKKCGQLIQIEGYLGVGPRAVAVRWSYTPEAANIAGMQQILGFPRGAVETAEQLKRPFQPLFNIVYTPDYFVDALPGRQAILVDLEHFVTYIMGPDYFGESKKAALRMLTKYVFDRGGLVLHAGAKEVRNGERATTMTIKGLSGTGKTTTTFSKQGTLTLPIQDDMVALWPGGEISITENGCFAKTFGLTEGSEPLIYRGTLKPEAWVENAFMKENGEYDFFKIALSPEEVAAKREILLKTGADPERVDPYIRGEVSRHEVVDENGVPRDGWDFVAWTQNGRSIIPMSAIPGTADFSDIKPVRSMGILNRDEGPDAATPGIVRFSSSEQASGYFMLGETTKTSAAGKERGKTRSPFTQPFFPMAHAQQATRFSKIAATMPRADMWMMNTGYVGGDARDVEKNLALKVKIRHSSAMLEAMLAGKIRWTTDPDFGYQVVDLDAPENRELIAAVGAEILRPVVFYQKHGRKAEYDAWVTRMKRERREFLASYQVTGAIIEAVCG